MRRAAVLGLALLAVLGGFLVWGGGSPFGARAPVAHDHAGAARGDAGQAAGSGGGSGKGAPVRIEGTVTDGGPDPLCMEDGVLRFRVDGAGDAEAVVREGEWEATAPKGTTLTIEEILFGDRKAVAAPATIQVPDDGKVEVVCRWLVPTLLRVIGEKGEEIEQVEYYETGEYDDWGPGWPEATRATSPIELACTEGVHTYLVRAPGHAWSRISAFVGLGGERVVRLVRAGSLDVRIEPYDPEWGISVRVDTDCYWEPDETGRVRIDSLRPGEHQVFAQVGRLYDEVREVAVWIDAGRTTEATIALGELPPVPDAVPLAGTIEVAAGWTWEDEAAPSCVTPSVAAWSVRESIDVEGPDEDGRWSAGDVRPGAYGLRLEAWPWIEAVEVGPEGATDVRLTVPPPCEVELRLVDEATGEPVLWEEAIAWCARAPDVGEEILDCRPAETYGRLALPEEPGVYRFRAPRGILHAWCWESSLDEPLRHGEVEAQLNPGLNRIELKVGWFHSADIVFKDGAMPVPADDDFVGDVQVTALQGGGAELERYEMRGGLRMHMTKPGRYRVSFPGIEGYESIAPVEVEVAPGTIPRVEIALRRRGR